MQTFDKQNYHDEIKRQLISGREITVQSVLRSVGTQELRHYISALKKEGLVICSTWISRNGKHFKKYWLDKEILKTA